MAENGDVFWKGIDTDGIECRIDESQWYSHVVKRPEIEDALELTKSAMVSARNVEVDRNRANNGGRYFRLLRVPGLGLWLRHVLVVSVKYVRQHDGRWVKFYQSCWYEHRKEDV